MEYTKKRVIRFVPSIHSLKERIIMSENDAVGEWPCFCGHIQQHLNLLLQSLKIALCKAQMWMILLHDRINDSLDNSDNNQFISRIGQYYTKIANILDVIESSRQRKRYFVSLWEGFDQRYFCMTFGNFLFHLELGSTLNIIYTWHLENNIIKGGF